MRAAELYEAGKLDEAIEVVGATLRDAPTDLRQRTYLFELLCFAGDYKRAEKHLEVLAASSPEAELGAWLYRSAIHAQRSRDEFFAERRWESSSEPLPAGALSGTLNGQPFTSLTDADPRIGKRIEVFAAGQYAWVPLEHVVSVRMEKPKRLRDVLWAPARVTVGSNFRGEELGEVLLPALAPLSCRHPDGEVRLGRVTDWEETTDGTFVPVGQKLLLVDGEPFPFLELRALDITAPSHSEPPVSHAASD